VTLALSSRWPRCRPPRRDRVEPPAPLSGL